MLKQVASAWKLFAAPLVYAIGRIAGNPAVSALSVRLDEHYVRGYLAKLQQRGQPSDAFGRFLQAGKLCASALTDVDKEILELLPRSNGQLLQDIVATLIHKSRTRGYFVEVGVGDGVKYSNTLLLERDFAWTGILAEPAAMFHAAITSARKAQLDRRAVSDETGRVLVFEQDESFGELSGLVGHSSRRGKSTTSEYRVQSVRFDDLLDEHRAPNEIHYVSIDTEGSELNVLKGLSLEKRRIWFFTIEHNFDRKRLDAYGRLLEPAGYRRILPELSSFDAWYVHRDLDSVF